MSLYGNELKIGISVMNAAAHWYGYVGVRYSLSSVPDKYIHFMAFCKKNCCIFYIFEPIPDIINLKAIEYTFFQEF